MLRKTAAVLVTMLLAACAAAPSDADILARAQQIHEGLITIDTHVDIPPNFATDQVDPGVRGPFQVDLPKMREGGLDAAFFVAYVPQTPRTAANRRQAQERALRKMAGIRRMTYDLYPDQIELAYSAADVERIHASGKLAAVISIENGYALGGDLGMLEKYYELGVRSAGLTHSGHNDLADSSNPRGGPDEEHGGLSELGREYVRAMNRLGIIVDVSHASKNATLQTLELSRAPVIASHSAVHALSPVPRAMDDEQLLALKENGGVIHIIAHTNHLRPADPERRQAILEARERFGVTGASGVGDVSRAAQQGYLAAMEEINERWPGATVQDLADHIDYAVDLIGVAHVGIGSDFDGGGGIRGFNDASESLNVTVELVRRGYGEEEIRKIWGENLLRVWRQVEQVAGEAQAREDAGAAE